MEFARLNLNYNITSKRKLRRMVETGLVNGWDDPRMLTIGGMRRRGFTPEGIKRFIRSVGLSTANSVVDMGMLEFAIRDDLNQRTARAMAVLRPLRVVITNYPKDEEEWFKVPNYPQDKSRTEKRQIPFTREIFVEQTDFAEEPPPKFFRLTPGREVRLLGAYLVTCNEVIKDEAGRVIALHCTYDPESKGGNAPDGRKVKGTIHWVSGQHAVPAEVRLYDRFVYSRKSRGG